MDILDILAEEFSLRKDRLQKTVELIDEGNTIPFIARYRKELTGGIDDTVLRELNERLLYLRGLEKRKEEVRAHIESLDKMTDEIDAALKSAKILAEVEDIYRPFKARRKTRASVARERGLEPLAAAISEQLPSYEKDILQLAEAFVDEEKEIPDAQAAVAGALDIIAEDISDNAAFRRDIRELTQKYGVLFSKAATEEDSVYRMYYDYSEAVKSIPDHRVLAINRGESEGFLKVTIRIDRDIVLNDLFFKVIRDYSSPAYRYMASAVIDSYERLIEPSIEREIRSMLFDRAGEGAVKLFGENLKNLLMQSPLRGKVVMGYDPGYRTGCKLAVVDRTGMVLDTAVIYPTKPLEKIAESEKIVSSLIRKYGVDVIAIGNGTASRESEIFIANLLKKGFDKTKYIIVSEAGASVYSASKLGAEEFPDFDVTQRSAVSIARRLQDPLAELVKIDPKSIGVGQYQHDMKPALLDRALCSVVEDCVNSVGVDVNTASYSLLSYISGINISIAKNIVKYREENGEFHDRAELLKVQRLGAKAYEQCAGFLRVSGSDEILDCTGVHPESYPAAKGLLQKLGYTETDVAGNRLSRISDQVKNYGLATLCSELNVGEPTLKDIIKELEKPGRDVRDDLPAPILRDDILDINDLKPGMELTGTVRNVIDFGVFVDIGVHQDGLLHLSQISDRYIKHPGEVLAVGDIITVRILSVDASKKRISLTMKK